MGQRKQFIRAMDESEKNLKRKNLLAAARRQILSQGFSKTTISGITREAGESIGTFYLYFSSKVEIFRALFLEALDSFEDHLLQSSPPVPGISLKGQIEDLAALYLHFYREHRPDYLIMFGHFDGEQEFRNNTAMRDRLDEKGRKVLQLIQQRLRGCCTGGGLSEEDLRNATMLMWSLMDGIILINERNGWATYGGDLDVLVRTAVDFCIRGLGIHGSSKNG